MYNYNLDIFRRKKNIFYYLLGVFLTDGNIFPINNTYVIQVTSKDKDWLINLQKIIGCALYPTKDGHDNLTIRSKEIGKILLNNGCLPNKSLSLEVPNIPRKYLPDFIRGCIDGDGSIGLYKNKKNKEITQCYVCSSSLEFLKQIQIILNIESIKSNIYEIKKKPYTMKNGKTITPKHKHYRLVLSKTPTIKLLRWAYYPLHCVSMPRKNLIAQSIIQSHK